MIYWILFWTFFKIGAVSFGGGYAMIPLIQDEMETYGWIGPQEFANILAVSQMTPGPIAINTATYVGVNAAGVLGSVSATCGVTLPSFLILMVVAHFFIQFKENKLVDSVLRTIRPVTIGLVCSAVIFLAQTSLLKSEMQISNLFEILKGNASSLLNAVQPDVSGIVIFLVILAAVAKFKLHPILAVVSSAFMGLLSYLAFGL